MYEIVKSVNNDEVSFIISSEMGLVDRVVQESINYYKEFQITQSMNFCCVLRELLINAIEHGNKKDLSKSLVCEIAHLEKTSFKITVIDQGDGFNYNTIKFDEPINSEQERKRGYYIINAYSDKLEFAQNGSSVIAYITVVNETVFDISDIDEWKVIRPVGDITNVNAEKFRTILVDSLNDGATQYRFDFEKVNDIDSISLSVLVCFARKFNKNVSNGNLEIVNSNRDVKDLFQLTRMDKVFNVAN